MCYSILFCAIVPFHIPFDIVLAVHTAYSTHWMRFVCRVMTLKVNYCVLSYTVMPVFALLYALRLLEPQLDTQILKYAD